MNQRKLLITGATGATGGHAVRELLQRGHQVRALAHQLDGRSDALAALGAEVVCGSLLDLDFVRHVMDGTDGAYFVFPVLPELLEASAYFAQAARETKLKVLVNMSQISARRDSKSNAARQHWVAERLFEWAGIPVAHIRPTFFAEWFLYINAGIKNEGKMQLPFGEARHAPIAAEDQARVIAAILENPDQHIGKIYPLFGRKEMTHHEIAEEIGSALGKPVTYHPIPIAHFAHYMSGKAGVHPHFVQHLSAVAQDYQEGLFSGMNDNVLTISGQQPIGVTEFINNNIEKFK